MALDGLSNQSVGIYRSKDPSQTTDKLTAKSKEKAEINISNVEDSSLIKKVDSDGKGNEGNERQKKFTLSTSDQLSEDENAEPVLDLIIEDDISTELEYSIQFNSQTKLIEMRNIKDSQIIETIKPEELLKVISKAKMISGVLVDNKI